MPMSVGRRTVATMGRGVQITFDAAEPRKLAAFWAVAMDYIQQPAPDGYETWEDFGRSIGFPEERFGDLAALIDPEGNGPRLLFQKVPEGKTAKNRVHLDINVRSSESGDWSLVTAHVDRLLAAGATKLYEVHEVNGECVVLQDPEGNEFCVQ